MGSQVAPAMTIWECDFCGAHAKAVGDEQPTGWVHYRLRATDIDACPVCRERIATHRILMQAVDAGEVGL